MNQIDLHGRNAVVTGGGSGMGRAAAERMLTSGARVMLWDLDEQLLAETRAALEASGPVHSAVVDVSDYTSVRRAAEATESAFGRIDILVNSAGITCPPQPIDGYSVDVWRKVVDVNLTGVFHCCRAVLPGMIARGYGRVINVASMAGKEGNPHETAYSAAKAGVIGLTKSLGKEAGKAGVLVNAVAPGIWATSMRTSSASADLVDQLLARTPLGRPGTNAEIAALVAWMASEECSYTTGFTFDASGGRATY